MKKLLSSSTSPLLITESEPRVTCGFLRRKIVNTNTHLQHQTSHPDLISIVEIAKGQAI
jgi:hypothetical protein